MTISSDITEIKIQNGFHGHSAPLIISIKTRIGSKKWEQAARLSRCSLCHPLYVSGDLQHTYSTRSFPIREREEKRSNKSTTEYHETFRAREKRDKQTGRERKRKKKKTKSEEDEEGFGIDF